MHFRNHPMSHNPNFLIIRRSTWVDLLDLTYDLKAPVPGWYNSPRKASAQHSQSLVKQTKGRLQEKHKKTQQKSRQHIWNPSEKQKLRSIRPKKQFQLPMFVAYMSGFMMLDPSHPNSEPVISLVWSCPNPRRSVGFDWISLGSPDQNQKRFLGAKINPTHRFPDSLTEQTSKQSKFAPKGKDGCECKI